MKKSILIAALLTIAISAEAKTIYSAVPSPIVNDSVESTKLMHTLKTLKADDNVVLYFNSVGGDVAEGLKMGAEIADKSKQVTCVLQKASSTAAVMLSACENIVLLDNASVMIHAARDIDTKGATHFNTPEAIAANRIFAEIVNPLLTENEQYIVFVEHKDLRMSGKEYLIRRVIVNAKGE